eukprot:9677114-Lingulodinium_polyedra.AAC.1
MVRIAAVLSWPSFIDWSASRSSSARLRRLIPNFVPTTTPFNSASRTLVRPSTAAGSTRVPFRNPPL